MLTLHLSGVLTGLDSDATCTANATGNITSFDINNLTMLDYLVNTTGSL